MKSEHETGESVTPTDQPPFLYEIRVKGRLSGEQWTSWFDDLTVTVAQGESTLRGKAPDHAALYGLLARLRDLAIPLVAVRVLDAEAQRKLAQTSRRYDLLINGLLAALYLLLLGGLATITVFVAPVINVALALTLLFALLGALAHAFWLWSGQQAWRWLSYALWPAAAVTFLIFIPLSGLMPPALGIAVMLLLLASGLLYAITFLRRHAEEIQSRLAGGGYRRGWSRRRAAGIAASDDDRATDAAEREAGSTD
jgi:hypothetical protein